VIIALFAGCAGGSGAPAPPSPCAAAPALPLPATRIAGPRASEDFTFDEDGYLLSILGGHSLVRTARGQEPTLVLANVVVNGRGLRALPGGDVVVADQERGLVLRIDPRGETRRLTAAIARPNGIERGPGGRLYVTDFGGGDVFGVHPDTGEARALAHPAAGSNGLAFSPDGRLLYVGDHDSGALYRFAVDGDALIPTPPGPFATGLVRPDGLATDECGDIYAASWDRKLYRISATGEVAIAATFEDAVSAVHFGSGQHGWNARYLYVMAIQTGGVYELLPQTKVEP
jgi:sugar lactone lactonase YvrE